MISLLARRHDGGDDLLCYERLAARFDPETGECRTELDSQVMAMAIRPPSTGWRRGSPATPHSTSPVTPVS
jgi:hypothetical protein